MSLRLARMAKSMKTHWVAGLAVGMQFGVTVVLAEDSVRVVREAQGLNARSVHRFASSQEPVAGSAVPAVSEVATPAVGGVDPVPTQVPNTETTAPAAQNASAVPSQNVRSLEPLRVKPLVIPNTSLSGIGTGITPQDAIEGRLPEPIPLPYGPDREGGWFLTPKEWVAPVYCHFPTYYEDIMLEQHGHERCPPLQPILSGGRFYSGLFFTPYLAYLHPPCKEISSAGNYRPGSTAPALRQRAPYDPGACGLQVLSTGTGVLLLQP